MPADASALPTNMMPKTMHAATPGRDTAIKRTATLMAIPQWLACPPPRFAAPRPPATWFPTCEQWRSPATSKVRATGSPPE
eukprot:3579426-Alexandrium_andersonii.AAC.1